MKKYCIAACIILASCQKEEIDNTPISIPGEIVFISRRISNSADWQMFIMNTNGGNQRLLSGSVVRCAPPVLSHDGKKVAFIINDNNFYYNLFIIDIDGQNQKLLSRGKQFCGEPSWSPDDSRIVFTKNDNTVGGTRDIYSITADGRSEVKLTTQGENFSPQYFPSGNAVVFSSSNGNSIGIYTMDADGTNKRLLTPQGKSFVSPEISPNGNMIAVTSTDMSGSQVFVMNADGSNLKQLTFTVSPKIFPGSPRDGNGGAVWSPDGNRLAYVSWENGSPDIFVINSNGSANKRLTDTPLRDENPYWTRDGNYILFSSNRDMKLSSEVYIMRAGGGAQTPLTNYISDDIYPLFISK